MPKSSIMNKTFAQAIREKYIEQDDYDISIVLPKDKSITTKITLVGFNKVSNIQKQLTRLEGIDLSNRDIVQAGQIDELKGNLDRVKTLNLADNSLAWHEVIAILPCVPNLRELILTCNRLKDEICLHQANHHDLKYLTLGRIHLSWTSIIRIISHIWSTIEQLDLWDSNLNDETMKLNDPSLNPFVNSIQVLKLRHNNFNDLRWLSLAGSLENLTELDVSGCKLESIKISYSTAKLFPELQILNISYNYIVDWINISNLHVIKKLRSLICHENPFFISDQYAKAFIIGRLRTLTMLNRVEISPLIRKDSDIFYLRKVFPDYQAYMRGEKPDFTSLHPRYEELGRLYGLPEDLNKKQTFERYINVELCQGEKRINKRLPCDMRIANVRMLCKRLFRIEASSNIQITCCGANRDTDYVLDKDSQTLHFFSVNDGQKLLIEALD